MLNIRTIERFNKKIAGKSFEHFFKRKNRSILLRLINSTAYREVDSGLKMLIEPLWLLAN